MNNNDENLSVIEKIFRKIIGPPRDINDPKIFHKMSLIAFFAWIGLGADGLSSSSYGPEEAFRTLGSHIYLAFFLALFSIFTVIVISYTYSKIIEHFPHGGGGYVVASKMMGEKVGVISGSALIVDYILTIAVSITSCSDALFSYLPQKYQQYKLIFSAFLIIILIVLNIRGVKESIAVLAPIFIIFILTHAILIIYGIASHFGEISPVVNDIHINLKQDIKSIGYIGIAILFLKAYSLGGGTYTGIEAVSNGLQIMREPKVKTGKRTMLYMASSLAITVGGLFLCYLLIGIKHTNGMTYNSILAQELFGSWKFGHLLAIITILSEGALLFVAAQTGFIAAPRVIGNMAGDSWFPRRFSNFSDRLTMRNGVIIIGIVSLLLLLYAKGSISTLVIMYSINVFLTFSISQFGMLRFAIKNKQNIKKWKQLFAVHFVGLLLCATILIITILEKFLDGAWLTLVITSLLIALCYIVKNHYKRIRSVMKRLDGLLEVMPTSGNKNEKTVNKNDMTAIQLVNGYNGFGIHTFLSINKSFAGLYKNFIFISVAVIDQELLKEEIDIEAYKKATEESLKKYVDVARYYGFPADYRISTGTNLIETASSLCFDVAKEFKHSTIFTGKLVFQQEKFYHRIMHNETAFEIQKHLQWDGITNVIMPIRVKL